VTHLIAVILLVIWISVLRWTIFKESISIQKWIWKVLTSALCNHHLQKQTCMGSLDSTKLHCSIPSHGPRAFRSAVRFPCARCKHSPLLLVSQSVNILPDFAQHTFTPSNHKAFICTTKSCPNDEPTTSICRLEEFE
jgi:hypothetical protein